MSDLEVHYTSVEVDSYLPSGWVLVESGVEPRRKEAAWAARVVDIADTEWRIEVTPGEVSRHGRLTALRREIDRVYREALG